MYFSLRFGLGKVHDLLINAPPPEIVPPIEESQIEGEAAPVNEEQVDEDLLKLPVDLTEPMYR